MVTTSNSMPDEHIGYIKMRPHPKHPPGFRLIEPPEMSEEVLRTRDGCLKALKYCMKVLAGHEKAIDTDLKATEVMTASLKVTIKRMQLEGPTANEFYKDEIRALWNIIKARATQELEKRGAYLDLLSGVLEYIKYLEERPEEPRTPIVVVACTTWYLSLLSHEYALEKYEEVEPFTDKEFAEFYSKKENRCPTTT